jgi:excisionase family DNA binding protein
MATQWLTLNEAAEHVGVHPRTIRRLIASGDLKAHRIGKSRIMRIRSEDLEAAFRPVVPE